MKRLTVNSIEPEAKLKEINLRYEREYTSLQDPDIVKKPKRKGDSNTLVRNATICLCETSVTLTLLSSILSHLVKLSFCFSFFFYWDPPSHLVKPASFL